LSKLISDTLMIY